MAYYNFSYFFEVNIVAEEKHAQLTAIFFVFRKLLLSSTLPALPLLRRRCSQL